MTNIGSITTPLSGPITLYPSPRGYSSQESETEPLLSSPRQRRINSAPPAIQGDMSSYMRGPDSPDTPRVKKVVNETGTCGCCSCLKGLCSRLKATF